MNVLAVDVGNSAVKFAEFPATGTDGWNLVPVFLQSIGREAEPSGHVAQLSAEARCWLVASVHRDAERQLARWVATCRPQDRYHLLQYGDLPIDLDVEFPERVGIDRLAAAVAANHFRDPNRPAIVVDAGSAVTVDLVSAAGVFLGGAILPGIAMSAQNLAGNTDALPLVRFTTADAAPPALGKNTEAAILSGLFWGTVGAIRELVAQLSATLDTSPQVFVTGGSIESTASPFLPGAQTVPNLVLTGVALAAGNVVPRIG